MKTCKKSANMEKFKKLAENGILDWKKCVRELVEMMADMSATEIYSAEQMLLELDWRKDQVERMVACAKRGLTGATHLYGGRRVLTGPTIMDAERSALEQISEPDEKIPYVNDNGKTVMIPVKSLSIQTVGRAWDLKGGLLSQQKQREKAKVRFRSESKKGIDAEITSAVMSDDRKSVDITINDNGLTITYRIKRSSLKVLGGFI